MKKIDESIKEESVKVGEIIEQELKGHSESLSFFSALALAHKILKSKIDPKGELKKP